MKFFTIVSALAVSAIAAPSGTFPATPSGVACHRSPEQMGGLIEDLVDVIRDLLDDEHLLDIGILKKRDIPSATPSAVPSGFPSGVPVVRPFAGPGFPSGSGFPSGPVNWCPGPYVSPRHHKNQGQGQNGRDGLIDDIEDILEDLTDALGLNLNLDLNGDGIIGEGRNNDGGLLGLGDGPLGDAGDLLDIDLTGDDLISLKN